VTTHVSAIASTSAQTTIRSPLLSTNSIRPTWVCVAAALAAVPVSGPTVEQRWDGLYGPSGEWPLFARNCRSRIATLNVAVEGRRPIHAAGLAGCTVGRIAGN
jgi:hypothetical protein